MAENEPKVRLTGLWEKTSQKGNKYFVGRLGNARVLMLANARKQGENDPDWILYVQEREEDGGQRPAPRRRDDWGER